MNEGLNVYVTENCSLPDSLTGFGNYLIATSVLELDAILRENGEKVGTIFLDPRFPEFSTATVKCSQRGRDTVTLRLSETDY